MTVKVVKPKIPPVRKGKMKHGIEMLDPTLDLTRSQGNHACWGVWDLERGIFGRSPFCRTKIVPRDVYMNNMNKIENRMRIRITCWPVCLWCGVYFYPEAFKGGIIDHVLAEIAPLQPEVIDLTKAKLQQIAEGLSA